MGRLKNRYEIGHYLEGLVGTADTLAEALKFAEIWVFANPGYENALHEIRVVDTMAHHGKPQRWAIGTDGKWWPIRYRD